MSLIQANSRTKFKKLVKAELVKINGKTIKDATYKDTSMTIHFTDGTHLKLAPELDGVAIEALLKGQPTMDYNKAAEANEVMLAYENGHGLF